MSVCLHNASAYTPLPMANPAVACTSVDLNFQLALLMADPRPVPVDLTLPIYCEPGRGPPFTANPAAACTSVDLAPPYSGPGRGLYLCGPGSHYDPYGKPGCGLYLCGPGRPYGKPGCGRTLYKASSTCTSVDLAFPMPNPAAACTSVDVALPAANPAAACTSAGPASLWWTRPWLVFLLTWPL